MFLNMSFAVNELTLSSFELMTIKELFWFDFYEVIADLAFDRIGLINYHLMEIKSHELSASTQNY